MSPRGWEKLTPADLAAMNPRALVNVRDRKVQPPQPLGRSNDLADALQQQLRTMRLPEGQREFRFDPVRRWRFDIAFVERMLACEVNGSEFVQGRHSRGLGMAKDYEKLNAAALQGWVVLQFTGSQVRSGYALTTLESALTL